MTIQVLIVDDEPNIRLLMEQALEVLEEDYGAELLMAQDGRQALDMIHEHHPDLVFLDVMMPRMSGLEVCRIIKETPALESIPVVILTAKGQLLDKDSGLAVGANVYMTKPFRPKIVLETSLQLLAPKLATNAASTV